MWRSPPSTSVRVIDWKATTHLMTPSSLPPSLPNYQIGSILIDIGSSVNIIFKSVFEKMGMGIILLVPIAGPLFGFLGEMRETEGVVSLPVAWGEEDLYTAATHFVIADAQATYNAIFSCPLLNTFRAVVFIYHVTMKFLAGGREIIV